VHHALVGSGGARRLAGEGASVKGQGIAPTRGVCYIARFMPTYEYECAKCRKTFECFQSMKDAALTTCPRELCQQKTWGKGRVQRLLGTGAGLIFKGSGFYITDYRSEGYKTAAKKDAGEGAGKSEAAKPAESGPKPAEKKSPDPKPVKKTAAQAS
jgi:putative FmdB family regulatory protein